MNRVWDAISTFPVASSPKTTYVVLFVLGGASERYEPERLPAELGVGRGCGEYDSSTTGRDCRADVLWLEV